MGPGTSGMPSIILFCYSSVKNYSELTSPSHLSPCLEMLDRVSRHRIRELLSNLYIWTLGACTALLKQHYLRQAPLLCPWRHFVGVGLQHSSIFLTVLLVLCPGIALPERPVHTHLQCLFQIPAIIKHLHKMIILGYTQNSIGYGLKQLDAIFLLDLSLDLDPSSKELVQMTSKDPIQPKLFYDVTVSPLLS